MSRDFENPKWKALRYACFKRDDFTCCKCGIKGKKIQAHHIIPVSLNPNLEWLLNNLITLCEDCHRMVTGKEIEFQNQFQEMIRFKKQQLGKKTGKKTYGQSKRPYRKRNPFLRF